MKLLSNDYYKRTMKMSLSCLSSGCNTCCHNNIESYADLTMYRSVFVFSTPLFALIPTVCILLILCKLSIFMLLLESTIITVVIMSLKVKELQKIKRHILKLKILN